MSSSPNRRLHDDGSGSASKYPHEDHVTYPVNTGKAVTPIRPDYHLPYDVGTVSKSTDRRLSTFPPASLFRSANDEHVVGSDTRPDFQDSVGKDIRVENRGLKPEGGKDVRHERDPYLEHKSEARVDKDVYSVSNIQFGWKEQRSKMQHDGHTGNVDAWPAPRGVVQGPAEAAKEGLHNEVAREVLEGREVARENKVDMKGDDKFREKERKRKEMKHRDWAERDKEKSDRRNISQSSLLGGGSGEIKEVRREERESERWAAEKKDKEKIVEKEKVHVKRETGTGPDKDISHGEKEPVAVQGKSLEQESSALELKKKEHDTLKNAERDGKREKEADIESERPDKRGRFHEKEADDCCVGSEGGVEREREAFNSTVQQRKRLLRPRGSSQTGNHDLRVGPQSNDIEGSQGHADGLCVVYKIGECMQELIKLWEEYALSQADKTSESLRSCPTLEIRIPAEHVTATNRQVRGGQLWGTDVYTVDSDLVAVLMHTGYCRPTATPPPPAALELRATIRVLPPQDGYISSLRNNVRSRAWGAAIGCSYCVERCFIVKKGGGSIELEPCLTHSSTMEPTLAPVAAERTMTTRAAASNALRQQRFVREVTIQFNLCMEPWLKYSISAVADKGLKKPLFTSSRLKKGEVLYVETHSCRYELCYSGEKVVKAAAAAGAEPGRIQSHNSQHMANGTANVDGENSVVDVFRWSRCKRPLPQKMMLTVGIPLPSEKVEVVADDLEWDGITWSQTGVWIAGKEYHLARAHFLAAK